MPLTKCAFFVSRELAGQGIFAGAAWFDAWLDEHGEFERVVLHEAPARQGTRLGVFDPLV